MSRPIHVLYVDTDLAEPSGRMLERADERFEVLVETTPQDGMERLHSEARTIDCVVSDYDMPGMDGIELLESVREEYPDLPFVLFTGAGSEEVASEAFAAGATDYFRKHASDEQFEVLAHRIENVVERWRAQTDYRRIFEEATDGILVHDPETGEILDANSTFCEMLGYDREALCSMSVGDFSVDEEGYTEERAEKLIAKAHEEGPQVFEWLNETESGEELPVEVHLKRTTLSGRDCVLAIVRDLSERKERQRELQQERAFIESLFDAVPDTLYALDTSGSLLRWNRSARNVSGYTDVELASMSAADFFEGEDLERIVAAMQRVMTERRTEKEQVDFVTKDGTKIPYEFVGAPLTDEEGELRGVVGAGRDVSRREERKQELERYETILDTIGDAVFELDGHGFFVEVNDYLADILGYEVDDLIGEHFSVVVAEDDLETARKAYEDLLETDTDFVTYEITAVTADGEGIPCEVRAGLAPAESTDGPPGTVGVVRDVSERKSRERQLERQNERLEEFASIVSHDLKNPLGVLGGRIQLAKEECENEHLDIAADTLDRMEDLIDRTLTLARKGRTVGETYATDISTVAEKSWRSAGAPEATLEIDDPPTVEADPDRLRHLFENLFGNAVEHAVASPGGAVDEAADSSDRLSDLTVTVGATEEGFYVADDGRGIPEDEREMVLDAGFTTSDDGTGIGLAIVRQIAEAHGWMVAVTESADGGTRFEFSGVELAET